MKLPDVPSGWAVVELGQVAETQLGKMLSQKAKRESGAVPYLRNLNVRWHGFDLEHLLTMAFSARELTKYELLPGDVVVCEGGEPGRAAVWRGIRDGMVYQKALHRVRFPEEALNPEFFVYQLELESLTGRIKRYFTGSTINHITQQQLRRFRILVAPRQQQDRIVKALDTHITRLDAGSAALERVQANLKRYRASVLKAACEGRLVPTEAELARREGRDYEPANVLLDRILKERRKQWEEQELAKLRAQGKEPKDDRWKRKYVEPEGPDTSGLPELPEGWVWVSVDAVLVDIEAGKSFRCAERSPAQDEVGVAKVSAVTWGEYDELESKTCLDHTRIEPAFFIRPGDFLFSRANTIELVGACVIARRVRRRVMLSDKILRFRLVDELPQEWLLYCLRSHWGRSEIQRLATGNQISMRNIGQQRIRRIRIPLPPAAEIPRILEQIGISLALAEQSEQAVDEALRRAGRLRQAILKRAFEGRLVPQDTSDGPASVLLERIRGERGSRAGGGQGARGRGARVPVPR